ncbi:MAG: hypothetical protein ACK58L_17740 [Planctomycetota bacterium]
MAEVKSIPQKQKQLAALKAQVAALESELAAIDVPGPWAPETFYSGYYLTSGFVLGGFAAMVSLLFNVLGSLIAQKHPLEIIRVYLTFPLGERALPLGSQTGRSPFVISDGMILALGCCLYIGTGMVLGSLFHCVISKYAEARPMGTKLLWGTILGVVVWFVNYYLILSWLQPMLFGDNWITKNELLPWWVALATHLIFGWAMALMAPFGAYVPYKRPTD